MRLWVVSIISLTACTADFGGSDPGGSLGPTGWKEDSVYSEDALDVRLTCEGRCYVEDGLRELSVDTIFDPPAEGLRRGNGNYYGMLGEKLWSFGGATCAQAISDECGGEQDIGDAWLVRIDSGSWSMPRAATCSTDATPAFVRSPFGESSGVRRVSEESRSAPQRFLTDLFGDVIPENESAVCDHPLAATVCGGDCLVDISTQPGAGAGDVGFVETLFSATPNFTQTTTVCADPFVTAFSYSGLSRSILELECERYFWNSARRDESFAMYSACAATRATIPCGDLVAQMP